MTYLPSDSIKVHEEATFKIDSVIGGSETSPLWASEIDSTSFEVALEDTLKHLGVFEAIDAKYDIGVSLKEVTKPLFGLSFTVETFVEYEIIDRETRETVFQEILHANGTATFSDAAIGVERLKIANERAGQENIKLFIGWLEDKFPQ